MNKARLLGMLASVALLAGTAACDSPTAGDAMRGDRVTLRLNGDAVDASRTRDELVLVPGSDGLAYNGTTTAAPAVVTTPEGTTISFVSGNTFYVFDVPPDATVATFTETIDGVTYVHTVVTYPDGSIVHFIYDPSDSQTKIYARPGSTETGTGSTGTGSTGTGSTGTGSTGTGSTETGSTGTGSTGSGFSEIGAG